MRSRALRTYGRAGTRGAGASELDHGGHDVHGTDNRAIRRGGHRCRTGGAVGRSSPQAEGRVLRHPRGARSRRRQLAVALGIAAPLQPGPRGRSAGHAVPGAARTTTRAARRWPTTSRRTRARAVSRSVPGSTSIECGGATTAPTATSSRPASGVSRPTRSSSRPARSSIRRCPISRRCSIHRSARCIRASTASRRSSRTARCWSSVRAIPAPMSRSRRHAITPTYLSGSIFAQLPVPLESRRGRIGMPGSCCSSPAGC